MKMWSSKDMRTGAALFAIGFFLGAFCFSNGAQLESMRTSRETWKSKAETAQTELYEHRKNYATEKKQIGDENNAQLIRLQSDLKMKNAELEAAKKALTDMETVRKEEIEKLDEQNSYLKERAEELQKKNTELIVIQQTSLQSIETFSEKNGEILISLLDILKTAAEVGDADVAENASPDLQLDILPELDQDIAGDLPVAELVPVLDLEGDVEGEAQAELNEVQVGFEAPPRAVANAQIHEEEFQQQMNEPEELQMDHEDDYIQDQNEPAPDDFNVEDELAGEKHDEAMVPEDHFQHIPEMQEHPIDLDAEVPQADGEEVPGMPVVNDIVPVEGVANSVNRLLAAEDALEKPEKKKKKKKKRRKRRNID